MKSIGFSIYDTKAEAFMPPWFQPTIGLGIRAFADLCKDPGSAIYKHLDDYRLFRIGEFDSDTGSIEAAGIAPILLATATEAGKDA